MKNDRRTTRKLGSSIFADLDGQEVEFRNQLRRDVKVRCLDISAYPSTSGTREARLSIAEGSLAQVRMASAWLIKASNEKKPHCR
jgi:hypothetical protein